MSRCLACNRQLSEVEVLGRKEDGTPEDMCVVCRYKAREQYCWAMDYEAFLGDPIQQLLQEYSDNLRYKQYE